MREEIRETMGKRKEGVTSQNNESKKRNNGGWMERRK